MARGAEASTNGGVAKWAAAPFVTDSTGRRRRPRGLKGQQRHHPRYRLGKGCPHPAPSPPLPSPPLPSPPLLSPPLPSSPLPSPPRRSCAPPFGACARLGRAPAWPPPPPCDPAPFLLAHLLCSRPRTPGLGQLAPRPLITRRSWRPPRALSPSLGPDTCLAYCAGHVGGAAATRRSLGAGLRQALSGPPTHLTRPGALADRRLLTVLWTQIGPLSFISAALILVT
uniref:Uncharacterized protein n=1 Tax=Rangifer tarandus platyrhynchus TaxID=3082113 RepID=A0ACB0E7N5_RANTA|nr:unnamed protein product [Rangifer tarandus platyrhynchus]